MSSVFRTENYEFRFPNLKYEFSFPELKYEVETNFSKKSENFQNSQNRCEHVLGQFFRNFLFAQCSMEGPDLEKFQKKIRPYKIGATTH